jgi:3-hydroxyisobutyrate dehydrogenase-like beta-hydroxyacid dehydrogenase
MRYRGGLRLKIGFIGLGTMGKPMAMNLLRSGNKLVVYDISPTSFQQFEQLGAWTSDELSQIADADIICMCLPDSNLKVGLYALKTIQS